MGFGFAALPFGSFFSVNFQHNEVVEMFKTFLFHFIRCEFWNLIKTNTHHIAIESI